MLSQFDWMIIMADNNAIINPREITHNLNRFLNEINSFSSVGGLTGALSTWEYFFLSPDFIRFIMITRLVGYDVGESRSRVLFFKVQQMTEIFNSVSIL